MVELDGRDRLIVNHVARFKQLSSAHVFALLFAGASRTPCDRALKRLTDQGYLHRVERRAIGGRQGGAGQYVYGLGRRGWFMHFEGRYVLPRVVNYHALAIADCYVALKRLERDGVLIVQGASTEPDCWAVIGAVDLRPDLYVQLQRGSRSTLLWIEMDMATEQHKQVRAKLESYWRAFQQADKFPYPPELSREVVQPDGSTRRQTVFPRIIWVGVDQERAKELSWLVSTLDDEARRLFTVTTREGLPALLG